MITRFYVDNYKSLVDFTYEPKGFELILGANGSGKSTVFEALTRLRDFLVFGASATDCFSISSLNRWQERGVQSNFLTSEIQRFQISISTENNSDNDAEEISYDLSIHHDLRSKKSYVLGESVRNSKGSDKDALFLFVASMVKIPSKNGHSIMYPSDATR